MPVDADAIAAALVVSWQRLVAALPDGWARSGGGALAAVTGVAAPTLNGVWPELVELDEEAVSSLLSEVAATGLPYCLQLRPGAGAGLAQVARHRGMVPGEPVPIMALDDFAMLEAGQLVDGLVVRELSPDEAPAHARIAAAAFGAPEEVFLQLLTPELMRLAGTRCYVGEVDQEPVTTGLGVTLGDLVGIFNIGTPAAFRARGYGTAITARAVADGVASGAKGAWLQTSAAGHNVYSRLGFRVIETWDCWLSPT